MRAIGILILWLCSTVPSCCESDDCYWQWYCFSSGGNWCAWYSICPGDPPPSPETFKADVEVFQREEGADSVDVRPDLSGDLTGEDFPLSAALRGPGISEARRTGPKKRWRFHGLPARWLRKIEAMAVGTDIRLDELLPGEALRGELPCDPVEFVDLVALPEIRKTRKAGQIPWLKSGGSHSGRLHPYVGIGPSLAWTGRDGRMVGGGTPAWTCGSIR